MIKCKVVVTNTQGQRDVGEVVNKSEIDKNSHIIFNVRVLVDFT